MRPPPLVKRSYPRLFLIFLIGVFGVIDLGLLMGATAYLLKLAVLNNVMAQLPFQHDLHSSNSVGMYSFFMLINLIIIVRSLQQTERLRQAAARGTGAQIPLERDFPSGKDALTFFPMVIRTHDKHQRAFNLSLVCVTLGALLLLPVAFGTDNNLTIIALSLFTVMIVILLFLLVVVVVMMLIRARMEVTPYGITLHKMGHVQRILWQDVRLFANYKDFGSHKRCIYEVSSSAVVLIWQYLKPGDGREPDLPWDTYQQQMDALMWLIAAKTGLPLYDVG